jgi:hypothetical protein
MDANQQGDVAGRSAREAWQPAAAHVETLRPGRNRLRLAVSFEAVETRKTVLERAGRFLESVGYRSADGAHYRRGSLRGNLISFTPRAWQVVVTLEVAPAGDGCKVRAYFDVNTTGQTVLQAEVEFWQAEAAGLIEAVLTGRAHPDRSAAYAGRARRAGLRYALVLLAGALVMGVVTAGLHAVLDRWLPAASESALVYTGKNPIVWAVIVLIIVVAVMLALRRRRRE